MDIIDSDYKLIIKNAKKIIYKSQPHTIYEALLELVKRLKDTNNLSCLNDGCYRITENPYTHEKLLKRFIITIYVPYTEYIIIKLSKGSIDTELFESVLDYVKKKENL